MRARAAGRDAEADQLFAQAQRIDPDAVAAVLAERDAALPAPRASASAVSEVSSAGLSTAALPIASEGATERAVICNG